MFRAALRETGALWWLTRGPTANGVSHETVRAQMPALANPEFWSAIAARTKLPAFVNFLLQEIRREVQEYRISRLQQALPDAAQVEMVGNYLNFSKCCPMPHR